MQNIPEIYHGFHIPPPTTAPTVAPGTVSGGLLTGAYEYAVSFITSIGSTNHSDSSIPISTTTGSMLLTNIPTCGEEQSIGRNIYRSTSGGDAASLGLLTTIYDNVTTSYLDVLPDTVLGVAPVTLSTADQIYGNYGTSYFNGLIQTPVNSFINTDPGFLDTNINGNFIEITFKGLDLASQATPLTAVINNNYVSANSVIHATIQSYIPTLPPPPPPPVISGTPYIHVNAITDRSFSLTLYNIGNAALNGDIIVYCSIIN